MTSSNALTRAKRKVHRVTSARFARRSAPISFDAPVVSFTFDDAPKSAFDVGREILKAYDARATYYVSLGLLDSDTEVGRIASRDDLVNALAEGCELGCHTFDHLDAQHIPLNEFVASVARNARGLAEIAPHASFRSFAYPKSGPTLAAKAAISKGFKCCRGGRETINNGTADLNLLNAVFLDRRTAADDAGVGRWIDDNSKTGGWLIFATHDVADNPSPYGCTPELLEYAVRHARNSGAQILPVAEACALLSS